MHVRSDTGKPLPPGVFALVSHRARDRKNEQTADREAETHEVTEVSQRHQDGERSQNGGLNRSRAGHQSPSVIGNRQAPSMKLAKPKIQAMFMARSAANKAATRSPRCPPRASVTRRRQRRSTRASGWS